MIDLRYAALEAVIETGSFELAARRLAVTQSAVSQRIRLLEAELGQVLLVRSKPVRPTVACRRLLPYLAQMRLLQTEAGRALAASGPAGVIRLPVGVNADSLATWFWGAVAEVLREERVVLDCVIDDQDHTHTRLAGGEVLGCLSTRREPLRGCAAIPLGVMRYRCIASPAFRARHAPSGLTRAGLAQAPAIVYGQKDDMQHAFLRAHFGLEAGQFPHHVVPSSEGFVHVAEAGLGYGFIPEIQVAAQLADGRLIDLAPRHHQDVVLYWHHWLVQSPVLARLSQALEREARRVLMRLPEVDDGGGAVPA